jgi:hypothetical protein
MATPGTFSTLAVGLLLVALAAWFPVHIPRTSYAIVSV